jgi:inhibitor of cysteine peptidase
MATVTLTNTDNGKSIQLRQGEELVLRLPENPTTGYRWEMERAEDILEQVADTYTPDPNIQFGSGGTRELRFRARAPGTGRLELKHWQAWEGERSVTERFGVEITVAG